MYEPVPPKSRKHFATINPANDTLGNLVAYMRSYLGRLFDEQPAIRLDLEFPSPESIPAQLPVDPELKRSVLLILKEALTNILKHSGADTVRVSLRIAGSLEIHIQDNGKGFSEGNGNGNGHSVTVHAE